jgi:hypothetical protein
MDHSEINLRKLLEFLEVSAWQLFFEAEFFLGSIQPIYEEGLDLGARDYRARNTEIFPLAAAHIGTHGERDLALYCYVWALRRLAEGRCLVVVRRAKEHSAPFVADPLLRVAQRISSQRHAHAHSRP